MLSTQWCGEHIRFYEKQLEEENKKLKEENEKLKQFQEKYLKMQEYIESREVKYCDTCGRYGEEHIDLECDDDGCYWCENCKDKKEDEYEKLSGVNEYWNKSNNRIYENHRYGNIVGEMKYSDEEKKWQKWYYPC